MTHPVLYHLALQAEWEEAVRRGGPYDRSTLGVGLDEQGFVHCSFSHQVGRIADLVYRRRRDVVVLAIDPSRLAAEIRVEAGDGCAERFPHIYGPIPLEAVVATAPVALSDHGGLEVDGALASTAFAAAVRSAPARPGMYALLGDHDRLLYVGKAAHLRHRLGDHQREARRGGWRGRDVRTIRWEEATDAASAAVREADVVVALRPPRNKALAGEGRWAYVIVTGDGRQLRLQLGAEPVASASGARVFGVFPHLGAGVSSLPGTACSDGYAALVRLLWAAGEGAGSRSRVPARLASGSPPPELATALPKDLHRPLFDLLAGTSARLLPLLAKMAAGGSEPYLGAALRRDVDAASAFFKFGPRALRALRLRHGLPAGFVDQATFERLVAEELQAAIGPLRLDEEVRPPGARRRTRIGWIP